MHNVLLNSNKQNLSPSHWGNIIRDIEGKYFKARIEESFYNKRISILDYNYENKTGLKDFFKTLDSLCLKHKYGKIWGKISAKDKAFFLADGFISEAEIINYFGREKNAFICSKYFWDRAISRDAAGKNIKKLPTDKVLRAGLISLSDDCRFKIAADEDLGNLACLYQQVFTTYPYPVFNEEYLRSTMDHIIYVLIYRDKELLAAAAAEINNKYANAEMTDFAVLPSERGKGLASFLLNKLEEIMKEMNIYCLYTIARRKSPGMNRVFEQADYLYTGTLINNCNISGGFEDMNLLCKMSQGTVP